MESSSDCQKYQLISVSKAGRVPEMGVYDGVSGALL